MVVTRPDIMLLYCQGVSGLQSRVDCSSGRDDYRRIALLTGRTSRRRRQQSLKQFPAASPVALSGAIKFAASRVVDQSADKRTGTPAGAQKRQP